MSDPSVTKSKGLIFAEQQMQRHGWSEGKGLGKNENGISQAIKVKVKCDTAGVGHNSAEQFTFHWWDHVFNKTASSISIQADKDGVQVKKLAEDDCIVTNKKPRKGLYNPNMLYGRFIKSATLLSGGEKPVEQSSSSESSDSSEDEDEKLDLSSATKLTDDDLIRVCGGRTAHKGARHGLTMSAKLSRLQEQEREFMEKYGKKEQKSKSLESNDEQSAVAEDCDTGKKHKKKKKQKHDLDTEETLFQEPPISKKKKKSKKEKVVEEGEGIVVTECDEQMPDQEDMKSSKKKKKRKQRAPSPSPEEQVDHSVDSAENCVKAKKKKHCKAE
ncbi:G patch domain-containing protein 4 [Bombina bombina]|uniref:G patch domain-containing protein 4 n=1 Tax=Bombina bombina TaxID=8345 RepID=UPI00235A990F|nr:G patch domain-containing protein 4 [Bombina bombina]